MTCAIPLAMARTWPDELQRIYAESMLALAERFGSYGGSPHWRAHQPEVFRALFDAGERERLLATGLPETSDQGERQRRPSPAARAAMIREAAPKWSVAGPLAGPPAEPAMTYGRDDFLRQTYLTAPAADELHDLLLERQQIVLYGPPGTGKTHVARHLARWLAGLEGRRAE